jgi:hypothetical protein
VRHSKTTSHTYTSDCRLRGSFGIEEGKQSDIKNKKRRRRRRRRRRKEGME